MLKRPPGTQPTKVLLKRMAVSTARLDGAPTAAMNGLPAMSAVWAQSHLSRPLIRCGLPRRACAPGISGNSGEPKAMHLRRALQDSFGKQKTGGEFEVVAGGSHGDGNWLIAQTDFEGFFDG